MKWFKHMAGAGDDEFIEWLEEEYGFEGSGRWWRICEKIAQNMDKNNNDPSAEHTWVKWQNILRGKRSVLISFLSAIERRSKMKLEQNEFKMKITIPKMLELRDEHTSRSGVTPDPTRELLPVEQSSKKESIITFLTVDSMKEKSENQLPDDIDPAVACCEILSLRKLSTVDQAILFSWSQRFDFQNHVLPILIEKTESFMKNNFNRRPATLSYFSKAVQESIPK